MARHAPELEAGEWSPREEVEPDDPGPPQWPRGTRLPLTRHPVPDIA